MLTLTDAQYRFHLQKLTTIKSRSSEIGEVGARYLADALKVNMMRSTYISMTASTLRSRSFRR